MKKINKIAYSFLIGDLFHYGHLKMLETARQKSDYHICGVISDDVVDRWISPKLCNYEERKAVIEKIKCVDDVWAQDSMDPTANLKKIYEKFPGARIMLVQSHHLWESVLGSDFISEINGEIITHDFYPNLSRDNIARAFLKTFLDKQQHAKIDFNKITFNDFPVEYDYFTTKANTLIRLSCYLNSASIESAMAFNVGQWKKSRKAVVNDIIEKFKGSKIVVRSSSLNEDALNSSNAGHYRSILNVGLSGREIESAVLKVIDSYSENGAVDPENQILVQRQTENVTVSGVIFTRNLWLNTPYYLINYDDDSGKTDSVTGGMAGNKIEIFREIKNEMIPEKWRRLIDAVKEIEAFFKGVELDIEFAIRSDESVVIFQVRPLAANSKFYNLDDDAIKENIAQCKDAYKNISENTGRLSEKVYLSDMAFWNPAELIGDRPNYLDYSLFNHLITKDVWNSSLQSLGYTRVRDGLVALIGGKPYVNVHNAFLSILPAGLPDGVKRKLLDHYNAKLHGNPELHDKIEFNIVHNCYHFNFQKDASELLENGFSETEVKTLEKCLLELTNDILERSGKLIAEDDAGIRELESRYEKIIGRANEKMRLREALEIIYELIEDCRTYGTPQFTRAARMAFIGNSLLKSMVEREIIRRGEYEAFMSSISTVATEFDEDFKRIRRSEISAGDFLKKYGHLRPGTYDITKVPYSGNSSYVSPVISKSNGRNFPGKDSHPAKKTCGSTRDMEKRISDACRAHDIKYDGKKLLNFIKRVIELREYYKFVYTKNISAAIELIAVAGSSLGLSREDMSHLDYYSIVVYRNLCDEGEIANVWRNLIGSRCRQQRIYRLLSLPPIIFSESDLAVVPSYVSKPNFITDSQVEGDVVFLDESADGTDINDKIIAVEKADPGYDWIFTKKIKALVTKYGGAASHMAIRCAEFNIPAAIGCGNLIFSKVASAARINLDCKNKTINVI